MSGDYQGWILPPLSQPLQTVLTELHGLAKGGLQQGKEGEQQQVKGLKFISSKLIKLFERNRKLKYSLISKVLIDNFSSESNDSRNIKRRVYDAINVMVAAGLFTKTGDLLEKQESLSFRDRVQTLKSELSDDQNQLQSSISKKRMLANRLSKRRSKLSQLMSRNRSHKSDISETGTIANPIFVGLRQGVRRVRIGSDVGETVVEADWGKSVRGRGRCSGATEVYRDVEYLQHL